MKIYQIHIDISGLKEGYEIFEAFQNYYAIMIIV